MLNQDELLDILEVSRIKNEQNNLTGMLLYGEGVFIQVLEGEEETLENTFRSIERDDRHYSIIKMTEGYITERNFPDWRMGFKAANANQLAEFDTYVNPRQPGFLGFEKSNAVVGILKTFANSNRMSEYY